MCVCDQVKAEASWDCTVHECVELSRGGGPEQYVYLTVRVAVLLSHPAQMQLILRKRICVSLAARQVRHTLRYRHYCLTCHSTHISLLTLH